MRFRAKLTIAMVLLLSLTYGIGGSLMIAQSFSSSIARERDAAVQTYRMIVATPRCSTPRRSRPAAATGSRASCAPATAGTTSCSVPRPTARPSSSRST